MDAASVRLEYANLKKDALFDKCMDYGLHVKTNSKHAELLLLLLAKVFGDHWNRQSMGTLLIECRRRGYNGLLESSYGQLATILAKDDNVDSVVSKYADKTRDILRSHLRMQHDIKLPSSTKKWVILNEIIAMEKPAWRATQPGYRVSRVPALPDTMHTLPDDTAINRQDETSISLATQEDDREFDASHDVPREPTVQTPIESNSLSNSSAVRQTDTSAHSRGRPDQSQFNATVISRHVQLPSPSPAAYMPPNLNATHTKKATIKLRSQSVPELSPAKQERNTATSSLAMIEHGQRHVDEISTQYSEPVIYPTPVAANSSLDEIVSPLHMTPTATVAELAVDFVYLENNPRDVEHEREETGPSNRTQQAPTHEILDEPTYDVVDAKFRKLYAYFEKHTFQMLVLSYGFFREQCHRESLGKKDAEQCRDAQTAIAMVLRDEHATTEVTGENIAIYNRGRVCESMEELVEALKDLVDQERIESGTGTGHRPTQNPVTLATDSASHHDGQQVQEPSGGLYVPGTFNDNIL